jgi:glycine dehydrogenase
MQAAYPASWVRQAKFWPTTSRVDNVYGDRHLVLRLPKVSPQSFGATVDEPAKAATA